MRRRTRRFTARLLAAIPATFAAALFTTIDIAPARCALVHQWTFNGNAIDLIGSAHGLLGGNAIIEGDRLALDGLPGTRLLTTPLGTPLSAKTAVPPMSPPLPKPPSTRVIGLASASGATFIS